jgi:hypothetical protein
MRNSNGDNDNNNNNNNNRNEEVTVAHNDNNNNSIKSISNMYINGTTTTNISIGPIVGIGFGTLVLAHCAVLFSLPPVLMGRGMWISFILLYRRNIGTVSLSLFGVC